MKKYYTRACNFCYGSEAADLIKQNKAFPLNGNKKIAFCNIEIFIREKNRISSKIIKLEKINTQIINLRKKIKKDLKIITSKKKYFNTPNIMGILNMTPDSFSDGGKFNNKKKALKQINSMIRSGAQIIDIGGESTRPGSKIVPWNQEWNRIKNIIKIFKKKFPKTLLSIDTRKSQIMTKTLDHRVDIINDVSSFNFDPLSYQSVKKSNSWKVIHHMQGNPQNMQNNPRYKNALLDIYDFFENKINNQFKSNKNKKKIILDPGIGFGKNLKHNLMILNKISIFHSLGFPILIGTSRKRFISQISGRFDTRERLGGTISSVLFTLLQGVQIFRVHNVDEVKQGILVYKKLLNQ